MVEYNVHILTVSGALRLVPEVLQNAERGQGLFPLQLGNSHVSVELGVSWQSALILCVS